MALITQVDENRGPRGVDYPKLVRNSVTGGVYLVDAFLNALRLDIPETFVVKLDSATMQEMEDFLGKVTLENKFEGWDG